MYLPVICGCICVCICVNECVCVHVYVERIDSKEDEISSCKDRLNSMHNVKRLFS